MQRWWIVVVAVVGIGLAFLLFPSPDLGDGAPGPVPVAAAPDAAAPPAPGRNVTTLEGSPEPSAGGPSFGSKDVVKPSGVEKAPQPPEVLEAQQRLRELRARPDAQASANLIGSWGGLRKTLLESESDEARDFAERLRQPLQDLAEFRRNPERGVPFDQIRGDLDRLHEEISASPFASEGHVPAGLAKHREVIAELDAKEGRNGSEEAP